MVGCWPRPGHLKVRSQRPTEEWKKPKPCLRPYKWEALSLWHLDLHFSQTFQLIIVHNQCKNSCNKSTTKAKISKKGLNVRLRTIQNKWRWPLKKKTLEDKELPRLQDPLASSETEHHPTCAREWEQEIVLVLKQQSWSQGLPAHKLLGRGQQNTFYSHHIKVQTFLLIGLSDQTQGILFLGFEGFFCLFFFFLLAESGKPTYKLLPQAVDKDTQERKERMFPPSPPVLGHVILLVWTEKTDLCWGKQMCTIKQGLYSTWDIALTRCKREVKQQSSFPEKTKFSLPLRPPPGNNLNV